MTSLFRRRVVRRFQIDEIDEHEGFPFIAMEYGKGKTLREILADGPLPNDKLIRSGVP